MGEWITVPDTECNQLRLLAQEIRDSKETNHMAKYNLDGDFSRDHQIDRWYRSLIAECAASIYLKTPMLNTKAHKGSVGDGGTDLVLHGIQLDVKTSMYGRPRLLVYPPSRWSKNPPHAYVHTVVPQTPDPRQVHITGWFRHSDLIGRKLERVSTRKDTLGYTIEVWELEPMSTLDRWCSERSVGSFS